MAPISLREYAYEIRQRIDDGKTGEAIPLAQYLLRRHPRYLLGYQLLAEAALEQGNYHDAIEIFRRVLSADPENFAAHAGLASAYADQNNLDEALWHMTRAFEHDPGRRAVREQLRYLHELKEGRAPGRLHLNRAALARNYIRIGAHEEAIYDLVEELTEDPDRVDLRVALAEAYWFANFHQQAAETAYQILGELPLALKPHLILANFYYDAGDVEQAESHLRIAQELDPENDVALGIFGEGNAFRAIAIPIESADDVASVVVATPAGMRLPEWLADLSLFADADAEPPEDVDWDAIIAHEDDWRTQLARVTREEVAAYQPNWRASLRMATVRALHEKGVAYPIPAEPVSEPEPDVALAENRLGDATEPLDTETADHWRDTLYEETVTAFPDVHPEWHATLRFATEETLAHWEQPDSDEAIMSPPTADLPILEYVPSDTANLAALLDADIAEADIDVEETDNFWFPPADTSEWVHALREASDSLVAPTLNGHVETAMVGVSGDDLVSVEAAPAIDDILDTAVAEPVARVESTESATVDIPRPRHMGRWLANMRVATEIWLTMQRRNTIRRGTGPLGMEPPVEARTQHGEPPTEHDPLFDAGTPVEAMPPTDTADTTESENFTDMSGPEDLFMDVVSVVEAEPTTESAADAEPEAIEETEETVEASAADAETDSTADATEGSSDDDDFQADADFVEPEAVMEIPEIGFLQDEAFEPEYMPPIVLGPLAEAQSAWQAGRVKEAMGQYQLLFYAETVPDEALAEGVQTWLSTNEAPALAYQLMGDILRRMGKMQEAVEYYREAINRM